MISRRTLRMIARALFGMLLFAQAALALAGCDRLRAAPSLAINAGSSQAPCHEEPTVSVNLCLAHCLSADQSADTPQVVVPAWVHYSPIVVAAVDRWTGRAGNLRFELPRSSAPPPRILFQVFLI